jgi:MerR family transcriptional regulator, redox-sensitive transcriptional activator SoxR
MSQGLTIGDLSHRTGLAPSAIRYYETLGIIAPLRNAGGHRRYARSDIRRLSFIIAGQRLGFALADLTGHLAGLPPDRAPARADWTRIALGFRTDIAHRIAALQDLSDKLDGCIGCGCLSLDRCALYNPADAAAAAGPGPRRLRAP